MLLIYLIKRFIYQPIDGRTIATGRFPASSSNICSVSAFVNVYVFGRLPIKAGVNFWGIKKSKNK